jgi:hypothetical protein
MSTVLTNANITTTILTVTVRDDNRKEVTATLAIAFAATLAYPVGGVPLVVGQFGMSMDIDACEVLNDNGAGYIWQFMPATNCLRMFFPTTVGGATAVGTELTGGSSGTTPATVTIQVKVLGR